MYSVGISTTTKFTCNEKGKHIKINHIIHRKFNVAAAFNHRDSYVHAGQPFFSAIHNFATT
jgi:hypothetical protein